MHHYKKKSRHFEWSLNNMLVICRSKNLIYFENVGKARACELLKFAHFQSVAFSRKKMKGLN